MSFSATDFDKLVKILPALANRDVRTGNTGFFEVCMKGAQHIIPEGLSFDKKRIGQTVNLAVQKKGGIGNNGARYTGAITPTLGSSAMVAVTYATVQADFSVNPIDGTGNHISAEARMAFSMNEAILDMKQQIETIAYTAVNAAKSIYQPNPYYPFVANKFQAPQADITKALNAIVAILGTDQYSTNDIDIIMDPMYMVEIMGLLENADQNAVNQARRLLNKNLYTSSSIVPGAGVTHEFLAVIPGSCGITNWNENDATQRTGNEVASKGTFFAPNLGMEIGLYQEHGYVDGTANVGATATWQDRYSLSTDIAIVTEYLSTPATDPASIKAVEIMD